MIYTIWSDILRIGISKEVDMDTNQKISKGPMMLGIIALCLSVFPLVPSILGLIGLFLTINHSGNVAIVSRILNLLAVCVCSGFTIWRVITQDGLRYGGGIFAFVAMIVMIIVALLMTIAFTKKN